MRNINISWKIMNDPAEPREYRFQSEAEVREFGQVGMFPTDTSGRPLSRALVLGACHRIRSELGIQIGPQPVRFTEKELNWLIGLVASVEFAEKEQQSVLAKLRHKEKTMRSSRNQDKRRSQ